MRIKDSVFSEDVLMQVILDWLKSRVPGSRGFCKFFCVKEFVVGVDGNSVHCGVREGQGGTPMLVVGVQFHVICVRRQRVDKVPAVMDGKCWW